MAESHTAVFLSYAKQDAPAAERICAALRAAGVEVWFDQNALRGGDAWDAAIRRQIKACALFIPIISANTQARAEGYFRLEWKLAIDRSHLMSADRAFLMPVCVDGTNENDERVPERFREVQWTQLPDGNATPDFAAHVRQLLAGHDAPAMRQAAAARPAPVATTAAAPGAASAAPLPPGTPRVRWAWVAGLVLAVAGATLWATRHSWLPAAQVAPYSTQDRRMTFAVLPFEAPGDDAHAVQVATATGARLRNMLETKTEFAHVAPHEAAVQAAARKTGARELATALNVHFLVRGTVARAATGYTVTVLTIDGDSERVLKTQSLNVAADALTPRWLDDIEDTVYGALLAGIDAEARRASALPVEQLDVRDLSFRAYSDWRARRKADGKGAYVSATDLLKRALALAPEDPLALEMTASVNLCDCINGWSKNPDEQKALGAEALERSLRINPSSRLMLSDKAEYYQLRGRWEESVVIADSLLHGDPDSADALGIKSKALVRLGRAKEALPLIDSVTARYPSDWPEVTALAADAHYAVGDYAGAAQLARSAAARMSEEDLRNPTSGPVRLTLIAAEARSGHLPQARAVLQDFTTALPAVTTIAAMKKWIYPSAALADHEPLFEGLRMAGVGD